MDHHFLIIQNDIIHQRKNFLIVLDLLYRQLANRQLQSMLATLIPFFDKDMKVCAYSLFSQKENLLLNPARQASGINDGAARVEGLDILQRIGIDTLSPGTDVFVPVGSIAVFSDIESQSEAMIGRLVQLHRERRILMKLVILERNSVGTDVDVSCFEKFGEVTCYPNTVAANTSERVKDADIILANKAPLNESTLKDAPNVKLICLLATGFDNVDLAYCKSRSIKVTNVVNYCTSTVAQHTVSSVLCEAVKMISVSFYHSGVAFDSVSFLEDIKKGSREAEGCTVTNGHIDLKIPWQSLPCSSRTFSASIVCFNVSLR